MIHLPLGHRTALRPLSAVMAGGIFRLVLSSGGRIALQLLLMPALARILTPDAFGLMAMVMPIVVFTAILAEAGLVTGLVRAEVDLDAESSAFWLSTAAGLLGAACAAGLAFPMAWVSHQPQAARLLFALAPCLALSGAAAVPSARLQRRGEFGTFGRIELIAAAVGAASALVAALAGWNVFALAAQQLTLAAARLIGGLLASGFRPRLRFQAAGVRQIVEQSSPMLGANLLAYLSRSLDNLLIGLLVGARPLGFYATAYQVIQAPEYVLGASARTTALPAIAQAQSRPEGAAVYFAALRLVAMAGAPIAIGCSLEAAPLVRLVLGPAWAPAAALAAILAPLGLVWSCFQLNTAVLAGLGDLRAQMRSSLITSVLGILGILGGLPWGVQGVALGYAIGATVSALPNFFYVLLAFDMPAHRAVEPFVQPLVAGAGMALALKWWMASSALASPLLQVSGAGVVGLTAYGFGWMAFTVLTLDL
ncbi:MAG TPA: oligosaccharide flippase family protein [Caulobacteraceae bacterium]|jgi:PST family polysaccharide transporter